MGHEHKRATGSAKSGVEFRNSTLCEIEASLLPTYLCAGCSVKPKKSFIHLILVDTHKLKTACIDKNKAGTLKVSKNTSAAFSLFLLGFNGASVKRTGCSSENVDS